MLSKHIPYLDKFTSKRGYLSFTR